MHFAARRLYVKLVILAVTFIMCLFLISATFAVFMSFLMMMGLFRLDGRLAAVLAFLCLAALPFALVAGKTSWAEQVAHWAFYLLATFLMVVLIEFLWRGNEDERVESGNDLEE